eukprot:scaffold65162_cov15-Tisochrysis_lutea.AAC.1
MAILSSVGNSSFSCPLLSNDNKFFSWQCYMQLLSSHGYYAELAALYKHYSKHGQSAAASTNKRLLVLQNVTANISK